MSGHSDHSSDEWEAEEARRQKQRDEQEYRAGIEDARRWKENKEQLGEAAADAIEYDRDLRGLNGEW